MKASSSAKPLAMLSALAAILVTPAATTSPLGSQAVCAAGTCCPETSSWCYPTDDPRSWEKDHYYKADGSCKEP